jgi:hypothetical protein
MDDRREPPAESGTWTEPIPADELSPVQQVHGRYRSHSETCPKCRDIDRGRCDAGEQLWRDWTAACDEAYRQLHRGAR